jgi:proteic killer suppression protein
VLKSFRDAETEQLWKEERSRRLPASIHRAALKKLQILNAAGALTDLAIPPGKRLEPLKGARKGQYSIRINDQYRVCFVWRDGNAHEVEITDYH